jgi:threonine/homoserine/homoserine lactone efflux protein
LSVHLDALAGFVAFAFVASATPGPNNLMLMTSGVKFGFARTLPHLAGVVVGFSLMAALLGLGLDVVFQRVPRLLPVMRVAGSLYMIYLAMKVALAGPIGEAGGGGRPLGFLPAVAFQWVNPKAWVAILGALAAYAAMTDVYAESVLMMVVLFTVINTPSAGAWTLFGSGLKRLLQNPRVVRPFNLAMAAILVASIAPMLFE